MIPLDTIPDYVFERLGIYCYFQTFWGLADLLTDWLILAISRGVFAPKNVKKEKITISDTPGDVDATGNVKDKGNPKVEHPVQRYKKNVQKSLLRIPKTNRIENLK